MILYFLKHVWKVTVLCEMLYSIFWSHRTPKHNLVICSIFFWLKWVDWIPVHASGNLKFTDQKKSIIQKPAHKLKHIINSHTKFEFYQAVQPTCCNGTKYESNVATDCGLWLSFLEKQCLKKKQKHWINMAPSCFGSDLFP